MADRPKSEQRQRTELVAIRLLPEELAQVDAAAARRGISRSALLRGDALASARLATRSELIPIWQEFFDARWFVSVASTTQPDDPWSGWTDVDADARRGVVELDGIEYSPTEARALAEALRLAAEHAETFGSRVGNLLVELTGAGRFREIDHLPIEQQRAIRDALRAAGERYRTGQARPAEVSSEARADAPARPGDTTGASS